jgi:hypothetical protein
VPGSRLMGGHANVGSVPDPVADPATPHCFDLYTKEAIVSMYEHLEEGGILQIARFARTVEALRLLSNIRAALSSLGVSEVERSIAALSTKDDMMAVQLKKGRFSADEQRSILNHANAAGIRVEYLPDSQIPGKVTEFLRAITRGPAGGA